MGWTIRLSPAAEKDVRAIRDEALKRRIETALYALEESPQHHDAKKLAGHKDKWRIRVGDWRIVYSIDRGHLTILVITIAKRGEVYRRL